jgi:xanthine phosphoribosyltransferase
LKQYYSYENFKNDTNKLIKEVNKFHPEALIGVARGGLTLSHSVAEGLNIRNVETLRTELYDGACKREEIALFGSCHFNEVKRVLVLDDIADSGETLKAVMDYLGREFPKIEFKSATLFYKQTSSYEPHFWVNEAKNWIEFFWEKDFIQE